MIFTPQWGTFYSAQSTQTYWVGNAFILQKPIEFTTKVICEYIIPKGKNLNDNYIITKSLESLPTGYNLKTHSGVVIFYKKVAMTDFEIVTSETSSSYSSTVAMISIGY